MSTWPAWAWVVLVTSAGVLLRLTPWLAAYPLHRDEALYGAWARTIAGGSDPALLQAWVDKPPLTLYALAGSFRLFGVSDATLRLPGLVVSILTVPLVYGLAGRVLDRREALLAAALVAASPFAILFTPTAFTDPWLTLWLVAACWAALAGRPFWAGLALGLAVASKQTGVFLTPLVLGLLMVRETGTRAGGGSRLTRAWRRVLLPLLLCLAGFALVFGPVYCWDSLRWAKRPSFWARSLETYGGLALALPAQWPDRATHWAEQIGYLLGTPLLTACGLLLASLAFFTASSRRRQIFAALALYSVAYLAVHFFVTFQPWDRYLLPMVPILAILMAGGWQAAWRHLASPRSGHNIKTIGLIAGLGLLLLYPAWLGQTGRVPVGSDHSAYAGLDRALGTLRTLAPRSIVYHHSLGWHLDFYLYGARQQAVWWADVQTLADDAAYTAAGDPDRPQWLVLAYANDAPVAAQALAALEARGLQPEERQTIYRPDGTRSFTLYELLPPPAGL